MSAWMKPSNNRSSAPQELKLALSIENVACHPQDYTWKPGRLEETWSPVHQDRRIGCASTPRNLKVHGSGESGTK